MRNSARRLVPFAVLDFALAGARRGGQVVGQAVVGNGYVPPLPVAAAPGQLLTIYVQGMGANLTAPVDAQSVPLPASLAGISVTFEQKFGPSPVDSPLLSVFPVDSCGLGPDWYAHFIGINLQVPYEMSVAFPAGGVTPNFNYGKLTVTENGSASATADLSVVTDQIHIVRYGDSLTGMVVDYSLTIDLALVPGAPGSAAVVRAPDASQSCERRALGSCRGASVHGRRGRPRCLAARQLTLEL
jgi:uncharacterized protein (TIGR03437 family)